MRLSRAIPLLAVGAAAAWFVEKQRSGVQRGLLAEGPSRQSSVVSRQEEPEPRPAPPEPEPAPPEPPPSEPPPSEQPTVEQSAVDPEERVFEEPVDVTSVVDDLIAPGGEADETIVDAEVVPSGEAELVVALREEVAKHPDVPDGAVTVELAGGTVYLRGQLARPAAITELEERVRGIEGVTRVRNLLHLSGTPPPV